MILNLFMISIFYNDNELITTHLNPNSTFSIHFSSQMYQAFRLPLDIKTFFDALEHQVRLDAFEKHNIPPDNINAIIKY